MTTVVRLTRALLTLCLVAPVARSLAQEPRRLATPDSIPVELATALIASGGLGGEPILLVGSLPEWFSTRITVPSEARVLGSASLGSTVVGIYNVRTAPDVAVSELKTALLARGWKNPPPPPVYGGGFRPATMSPQFLQASPTTRATLCRDDGTLIVSAAPARGGATNVTLRLSTLVGPTAYSTCNPPPRPEMPANRPMFPTLYDPPITGEATTAPNACFPNYNGLSSTQNYLRTTLSPDLVLEHYARQLQDSGWTATAPALSTVGRTFTRRDSTGAPIDLTLTVAASPKGPACRDVSMQVRNPSKP